MRDLVDRFMIGVGLTLFFLSLVATTMPLSKGSYIVNQIGLVTSIIVVVVGMVDRWVRRKRE